MITTSTNRTDTLTYKLNTHTSSELITQLDDLLVTYRSYYGNAIEFKDYLYNRSLFEFDEMMNDYCISIQSTITSIREQLYALGLYTKTDRISSTVISLDDYEAVVSTSKVNTLVQLQKDLMKQIDSILSEISADKEVGLSNLLLKARRELLYQRQLKG